MILTFILVTLFAVSAVSAAENVTDDAIGMEMSNDASSAENDIKTVSEDNGSDVGTFDELSDQINSSAIGGVLFIDEAYSLCRDKNDTFGLEAIDALVKGIEDNRDDLVVILAGYEEEMQEFLKTNSGLKSRFQNVVHFEDYSVDEMYAIAEVTAKSKGYKRKNHSHFMFRML